VALVSSGRPVAMSITAGVNSRVSLAASRPVRDGLRFFTYRQADLRGNEEDVATAAALARSFGLPHRFVDVPSAVEPPELDALIREATFLSHGRRLVAAYRSAFTPQTMHIRSNIGEVGRCYYRRTVSGVDMTASSAAVSADDLSRLWGHGDVDASMVRAFADWIAATRFREVSDLDALDLLYWEHRMACWHASVVLESDFAFDTHVLFNSRWVLERLLSVPRDDRCRGTVFRHLVDEMWPELGAWSAARPAWRSSLASIRRRVNRRAGR
jgi:hypothetical protein